MRGFATLAIMATWVSLSLGAPATAEERQVYIPCSGLYGTAQCCATDVLGVADLDCGNRECTRDNISRMTRIARLIKTNLTSPRSHELRR